MGLIETRPPTRRELAFFGAVPALFLGIVGALVAWQLEALNAAVVLWCTGLALWLVYFAVPPVRLLMYYTWMKLTFPIGWTISYLLLAIAYYLALAPIGLVIRPRAAAAHAGGWPRDRRRRRLARRLAGDNDEPPREPRRAVASRIRHVGAEILSEPPARRSSARGPVRGRGLAATLR